MNKTSIKLLLSFVAFGTSNLWIIGKGVSKGRFTDADAIALAYNSSPMKEIPNESGAGSAYAPNLAAALVSCFGGVKATGTLPVSVPEIDGNYQITDKILYEGGK